MSEVQPTRTGRRHSAELRVRYGETDQGGVVYHANYIPYFEIGRTELMRDSLGVAYESIERELGVLLLVVDVNARFLHPARYDERLRVWTDVAEVGGARVRFNYTIENAETDRLLCTGSTLLGSVSKESGRPCRMPALLRDALNAYQQRAHE